MHVFHNLLDNWRIQLMHDSLVFAYQYAFMRLEVVYTPAPDSNTFATHRDTPSNVVHILLGCPWTRKVRSPDIRRHHSSLRIMTVSLRLPHEYERDLHTFACLEGYACLARSQLVGYILSIQSVGRTLVGSCRSCKEVMM